MQSVQFTDDNAAEVAEFLGVDSIKVQTGPASADPELRIAGRRYFQHDLAGWGQPEYFAHIVVGDWLVRMTPSGQVLRYYPEQYKDTFPA